MPLDIEARSLARTFEGGVEAVRGIDLTVSEGEIFGFLGPNGAGKTTSLRMLLGLIRPTEGRALLFGRDPLEVGARALDGVAGFVEGPRFYPYLSGRKNLRLLGDLDGGVQLVDGELRFQAEAAAVEAATVALGGAGIGISALVPHTATLEELFLGMTEEEAA